MPLRTTVIGSYPKPAYLELPDWFSRTAEREYCADSYTDYTSKAQQQGGSLIEWDSTAHFVLPNHAELRPALGVHQQQQQQQHSCAFSQSL